MYFWEVKKYKSKKEKPISEDEQLLIRKAIKEFCRDLNIATSINLPHYEKLRQP